MTEQKTNVMRLLDQKKIPYQAHSYPHGDEAVDGVTAAGLIGKDPACVFKTLLARGASKTCYMFVIPVAAELDLKKAAGAVREKSVSLLHVSELLPLTGYVRGGCSPIGMKKLFKTFYHVSAETLDTMIVSAGKIGFQVEMSPKALMELTRGTTADLITEE